MKRVFDIVLVILLLSILGIPMLIIAFLIKITSKGPVLYWSDRVGKNSIIFKMPKFRTMELNTPSVATHLLKNPDRYITRFGRFLRKTSLDELPQLGSVIKGDLSLVGPRPALYNQYDLIELRHQKKIDTVIPGITGWAQINGRDELPIPVKVEYDFYYLNNCSIWLDIKILYKTFFKSIKCESVTH